MIVVRIFVQTVFFALGEMWANKVRSMLTCLGIIIGVWAVTSVIAAVRGLESSVLDSVKSFGADKVYINGYRPDSMRGKVSWSDVRLSPWEANQIRERVPLLSRLSTLDDTGGQVRAGEIIKQGVRIQGFEPDWHEIEKRSVIHGRELTEQDDRERLDVCLINDLAIEELRLEGDGVGSYIFLKNRRFLVVGVVETKEVGMMFARDSTESEIFVPYGTLSKLDPWPWPAVVATMRDVNQAEETREQIRFVLRRIRNLAPEDDDTFRVFIVEQELEEFRKIAGMMTLVAGVLVGISLIVGGVGIMNIMLVSVSERTREIGLRKAVGANPLVILTQFLIEAVILCIAGGIVGLMAGQATVLGMVKLSEAVEAVPLENASIPVWAMLVAIGVSAFVGLVAGMYPAVKASRLDPIVALRHD